MQINISTMALIAMLSINIMACSNEPSPDSVVESDVEVYEDDQDTLAEDTLATEESDIDEAPTAFDSSLYKEINQDSDSSYLIPLVLAQTNRDMFDNERLIHMYPEYQQEQDPQKREEMAKELIPKMKLEMAKYEDPYRIKVEIIPGDLHINEFQRLQAEKGLTGEAVWAKGPGLKRYNFETKDFPLYIMDRGSTDHPCWFPFNFHGRIQESDPNIAPNEACTLDVPDQALAEKMSMSEILVKGTGYYRVEDLTAFPERVDLTFYDANTAEVYGNKTFTWSY